MGGILLVEIVATGFDLYLTARKEETDDKPPPSSQYLFIKFFSLFHSWNVFMHITKSKTVIRSFDGIRGKHYSDVYRKSKLC